MSGDDLRDPRAFRWVESGISGLGRLREWDAVATAVCDVPGHEYTFVVLEPGRILGEAGDAPAVAACAEGALAGDVEPPYRAAAIRRHGDTWAVGAVAIEVADLPADVQGDELMLTVTEEGERELLVDGRPAVASLRALERVAAGRHAAYVLRAARLEGTLWEVAVDPL